MKTANLAGMKAISLILNVLSWGFFFMALSNHTYWAVTGTQVLVSFLLILTARGLSLLTAIYIESATSAEALARLLKARDKGQQNVR